MAACQGFANGCTCPPCKDWAKGLPARLVADKDVRREIEILIKLGFVYTGVNGSGKLCFEHESEPFLTKAEPREITLSRTPGKRSWRDRHRHRLARYMGLSQWQLDRVIAGQPIEKVKREQGPGRKSNEEVVVDHAKALGIPCDELQARRLISRFGGTRKARKALDGMADAAANSRGKLIAA